MPFSTIGSIPGGRSGAGNDQLRGGGPKAEKSGQRDPNESSSWGDALRALRKQVSAAEYRRWFAPTQFVSEDEGSILVRVPHPTFANRLRSQHESRVRAVLETLGAGDREVRFVVEDAHPASTNAGVPARDNAWFAASDPVSRHCTFDSFVVGSSNRCAHAAAMAVSEPNSRHSPWNPLLIHGDVGVGKTHLLQAIANRVKSHSPESRVFLTKGESFTRHVVQAVRTHNLYAFRDQCRKVDVLLVDDVQFLAGLDRFGRSTEEFFHTLNSLTERGHQIVLTANAHPQDLVRIDRRIRNRLEAGLTTDIGSPDRETRVAILLQKASEAGVELAAPVAETIASRFRHNVRELTGALNRITSTARVNRMEISSELASELLDHGRRPATIAHIISLAAAEFGIPVARLPGPQRHRNVVLARHVAMYLCRKISGKTLTEIGRAFHRDHATVTYGVKRVEKERVRNPGLNQVIERLTRKLR